MAKETIYVKRLDGSIDKFEFNEDGKLISEEKNVAISCGSPEGGRWRHRATFKLEPIEKTTNETN